MIDIRKLTDLSTLGPKDIMYVWTDDKTLLTYTFAIGRMAEAIKLLKPDHTYVALDEDHYKFVRDNRGIEEHRLDRLRNIDPYFLDPIIMAYWPHDKSWLTLDGNHRTVALYESGFRHVKAVMCQPEFWKQFLVGVSIHDAKPERSGIL
jgi:hypothetical protein